MSTADPETLTDAPGDDVDMDNAGTGAELAEAVAEDLTFPEAEADSSRLSFLDYLKSPIIELSVGTGDSQTILTAHQAFLVKSPFFAETCAEFPKGSKKRRIDLPDDDLDAVGSVLEYLYNNEYFPKRSSDAHDARLEVDPSVPAPDEEGTALLKHARVYTLADKFRLPSLKSLAHSKIHRTQSTARGEIAYARYVYRETSKDDQQIRKPVAAFWATRSHVLRHEAENEFRAMCLEFPQFGFDVLSLVLDQKEKGRMPKVAVGEEDGSSRGASSTPATGRKRARLSGA